MGAGFCVCALFAYAESYDALTQKTINVFPAYITSTTWEHTDALFVQDYSTTALYQDFKKQGSAYIESSALPSESGAPPSEQSQGGGAAAEPALELPTPVVNTDAHESPLTETTTPAIEEEVGTPPTEEVPIEGESTPVSFFDAPFERAGDTLVSLFARSTLYLPLALGEAEVSSAELASPELDPAPTDTAEATVSEENAADSISVLGEENPLSGDSDSLDTNPSSLTATTVPDSAELVAPKVTQFCAGEEGCDSASVLLSGFAIPALGSGESIQNAEVRLSLGAKLKPHAPLRARGVLVEYLLAGTWHEAGTVPLTDEISNAINGGYFLFALPAIEDAVLLADMQVRVTYVGDRESLEGLYLDSAWLELNMLALDEEALRARVAPDALTALEKPKMHDLLSTEIDFTMGEMPAFTLKYHEQRNFIIRFFRGIFAHKIAEIAHVALIHKDAGDVGVTPELHMTDDGLWTIQIPEHERERLHPGVYTVQVTVAEGSAEFTDEFQFQWGLLAVNTHKSEYVVGEEAHLSLAALSPSGNTLCDAHLLLYVIDPSQFIHSIPVAQSGLCNGNNVVDAPDYTGLYTVAATGTHTVYVERVDDGGVVIAHTEDTFEAVLDAPIAVERGGPTRIYPVSPYAMDITVSAKAAFEGELVETIPGNFIATATDAEIRRTGDSQELVWHLSFSDAGAQTFSYSLDAPDISPYLYLVGPASVTVTSGFEGYVPTTAVRVATTSRAQSTSTVEESVTETDIPRAPSEETAPEESVPTVEAPVEPPSTDDTASETPPETPPPAHTDILPPPDPEPLMQAVFEGSDTSSTELAPPATDTASTATETATLTTPEINPESTAPNPYSFTEKRKWQIASDATGSMIVYWTGTSSIPSGWTCISCASTSTFYQKYIRGGATYGTTGGTTTTSHTASGTVYTSATANSESNAGTQVSNLTHAHATTSVTVAATSTLPQSRTLRIIQNNSAGEPATVPAGVVLLFDDTLPSGWTRYSVQDSYFPYGETTVGSTTGSSTHAHAITGTTSVADASNLDSRSGGVQVTAAAAAHRHLFSTTTARVNNEPPYISVILATSSVATATPTGAITMWTDTPPAEWLNRSAQSGDPFYDNFVKPSATYGTTGGASTHTSSDMLSVVSNSPATTISAKTGSTGSSNTHTHLIDLTTFSTDSHLPPYATAIFARRYGAVSLYTQSAYKWYANTDSQTPTDAWPSGATDLAENEPIASTNTPARYGDVLRLRMGLSIAVSTSTAATFKLQFGSSTSCSSISTWTDVGASTSSVEWRGYDNASTTDGVTLSSSTLSITDIKESYEENNPSTSTPNVIDIGQDAEWDFVLEQHGAYPGATYCFRMVKSDGTALFAYSRYPQVYINDAPGVPTLVTPFDNEKMGTTSPLFTFYAADAQSDSITYQINIDDDYAFGSVNVDKNSATNGSQFDNLSDSPDKDPFTNGNTIQFHLTSALVSSTTYYWRVRGQDPAGSNGWGSWSSIRSFTPDASYTASAWFQTTKDQFSGDTLVGTIASTSNAVTLASGSSTGTTTSPEIHFSWGTTGNAWDSLVFNDSHPTGTVKYKFEYYSGGAWAAIPDADLSGNSSGFGTTSVNLLGLDTTTYGIIRVLAIFPTSGGPPSLSDWTVKWGYKIPTPTITKLFSNEKTSTTTPTLEFTTTDPQGDSLVYQVQWSTTYAFSASTTRTSSTSAGFANITNATDTSPFNSGNTIQFTIQTSDALTDGTTYWWRVRAVDPAGSNTFSAYTTVRSFTVDINVTVSTWFQTTGEQFATDILSGATSTSGNLATVATSAVESLVAYAEGTTQTPQYRTWNGSVWSSESSAQSVGATINWTVTKAGKTREEYLLGTLGTDADVNVQVYKNGAWGNLQEMTTAITNVDARGLDITYENSSGDAMVAYCDGDADPSYYIWNGTSWTSGGTIDVSSTNNCAWIRLISDPTSDEIIMIERDTTGSVYEAQVWTGSAWGNAATWGSMSESAHEGIAAAYEESGNQAVIAVSNGTSGPGKNFSWRAWNGSAWTAAATQSLGADFEQGSLVADVGSDNMAICYIDDDNDIGAVRWTGSAWTGQTELETSGLTKNDRPFDCAFEVSGARDGYIMLAYSDATNVRYTYWNGTTWATEASVDTLQDSATVALRRTGANTLQLLAFDSTNDRYDYSGWAGSSWSSLNTLESDASVGASPFKEPFMIAARNPGTSGSVVAYPDLDYDDGSGPYWKQLVWNDTEAGGSSLLYQIEYYNSGSSTWDLVPNSLIPGNSSGTTTSPIDLSNLLPVASTYNRIRPVANFTCNLGTCPTLTDWTLTWAAGITISGTAKQFDQSTNMASGTVAVALNGVLQTGKTGSISGGTWSIANVNAHSGDVVTVFGSGIGTTSRIVGVTKYDGTGDVTGISLFERHLSIGSDDLATTTNADIALYDNTNSGDIFANVDGGNDLTVCVLSGCADAELYIKAGNKYQPGADADVTTVSLENNGTFLPNGNTIRVAGNWDNNATATMATSTLIFTATSTSQTVDDTGAATTTYYNVTFGETSGTATWTLVTGLDIDGALATTYGTLARGALAITVAGNLTNGANGLWTGVGTTTLDSSAATTWTDTAATKQDIGYVVIDGTSKTVTFGSNVQARSVTIGADDILSASSYSITVLRHWTNNNTFTAGTGSVIFSATTSNATIAQGSSSFYDLTFNGVGGSWLFTGSSMTVGNNFTVSTGTVTMPTGTTTVAGSWDSTGGLFAHSNGGVTFNASSAKTITLAGSTFTNTFYNLAFTGSGSWSFVSTNATTSNDLFISAGTVTFPQGVMALGGSLVKTGGTLSANGGTLQLTSSSGTKTVTTGGSSLAALLVSGAGAFTLSDTNLTATGTVTFLAGTTTLPSGTFTVGGSWSTTGVVLHNSGTVLFNSSVSGRTVTASTSPFYNATFNSTTGGWTMSGNATTSNALTLTAVSSFVSATGTNFAVRGTFTNSVGGASTTWYGGTLSLVSQTAYAANTKSDTGDVYGTLLVGSSTQISLWNSSAATTTVDATGYLYSEDHAAVDGTLYIYGAYTRTSGTEYWSAATDFDGTALATSSHRQVNVRFASSATASFSSTTLNITGTSTASTTIAAQSGTYTLSVRSGTTTASYYAFTDLGSSGFTLASSTKVTTLSDGAFTVAANSGTALTVSSTTIDANPALQIYRIAFATTTAISASNVTQTDGTPASYWWFRSTTGNLQGEAKDNDTGDPGSIHWDDSNVLITVAGTVYADESGTPLTSSTTVRVVVNGGTSYSTTSNSVTGAYSIPNVGVSGDPVLTVYLDTNGGSRATTITQTPTASISNLNLYVNRIVTRHEDADPLTIADMATYDETQDTDIRYDAATGSVNTLTVRPDTELHIASSTTFVPGGTVTLQSGGSGASYDGSLHIDDNAVFTGAGTSTYSIGGGFALDTGATFTSASTTVAMTATTTGKSIVTTASQTITVNNLSFTGVGGGWSVDGNLSVQGALAMSTGTLSGTKDITLAYGSFSGNGTVALTAGTTTINRTNTLGGSTPWSFYNLTLGSGSVVGTTTPPSATTTVAGVLTIANAHVLDAGTSQWNLSGSSTPLVVTGTFAYGTSLVRYSASTSTNITSTNYYNLDLNASAGTPTYTGIGLGINIYNNLYVGGTVATVVDMNTNDPALNVDGAVTIRGNGTLGASNSASFTAAGDWTNTGTFTANSGTVTFDGATSGTLSPGSSAFSTATVNKTGALTISAHATATAFTVTAASAFTVNSGVSLAVSGTFTNSLGGAATTWTGSTLSLSGGGNYQINASTTNDTYATLLVGTNTDIRMWSSSAATTTVDASGSLYSQDHAASDGALYIYGDYYKSSGTDYWSYATDFDGTTLGGSSRTVTVSFATNATATVSGGTLNILGGSTASTTITNQGSGTYALVVNAGTINAQYYRVRNINQNGLVVTNTPTVTTLAHGDIEVSQNGGSGMTVGGTAITQNPAKTFSGNAFSTSTGISSAYNVTATGTSVSSWRFTNHTGTLAGEAFDNDPVVDPGYIVWDDSAGDITISGTVYSDEGSTIIGSPTCDGVAQSVHLRVSSTTSYTTSCSATSSYYTIPGVAYSPGDEMVVYLDTAGGAQAANVTVDPLSSISNMHLYQNRVIVRHEDTNPVTIADMALWDSSDDADIPFTAVDAGTDTLTLPANKKLIVWNSKTFAPGGNMTLSGGGSGAAYDGTLELYSSAVFTAAGSETHSIGGSLLSGSGASITGASATFTFTATSSARTVDTNDGTLYNATFSGSGSWTITDTNLSLGNTLTISNGTVTLPTGTTTIAGSFLNSGGAFVHSTGTTYFTATASGKSVQVGTSSLYRAVFNGSGGGWTFTSANATATKEFLVQAGTVTLPSGTLAVGGQFNVSGGAVTHNSGTLRLTATTSSTTLRAGGSSLFAVTFAGSGSYVFQDTNATLLGSLSIATGSVTLATGTLSIGGSFLNTGGSFSHASGTILFNSTDTGETINPGASLFNNVSLAAAGGGWTISVNATTSGSFSLSSASSFTQASSTRLTVYGVFTNTVGGASTTWTGSTLDIETGTNYTINTISTGFDQYQTLLIGTSTDIRMWNSSASSTTVDPSGSLYSQDHANVNGALYIYGDYGRTSGTDYWSYATDFDGSSIASTSRAVTVSFASNATATYSGATLAMIGALGATTTVQNQGSGTYALVIDAGTINAQYYAVRNGNVNGLYLTGLATVTSLSYGDFLLGTASSTLLTVSSTTVNANAASTYTSVRFATSTAITGKNVTLLGTTTSAWTFSVHTGNLAGEAYDVDGATSCGSIRWSDSSCLITEQTHYRWRNDDGGEGVPNSEWYNASWSKRKRVALTNADATGYVNAVVKVPITYDADMQSDFDDIRFTDSTGVTALQYWIETYSASVSATAWVKVPLLATSTVTNVYMYYGNGGVSGTGVGTTTFPVFDNFEDGGITEYSGDTSQFSVGSTNVYERTYRLNASDVNGRTTDGIFNLSASTTVSQGQTIRYFQYIDTSGGSGDEACTLFGVQSPGTANNNYGVCLELFGVDRVSLSKNVYDNDTNGTVLASSTMTFVTGWHEVEIKWGTSNTIAVTVYRSGSVVATTSATDSSYTTGGIGFTYWFQHGGWDIYTARSLLTSEPTVTTSVEQSSSGATWYAALDAAATGVAASTTQRLRFVIENSGLEVTNQQVRLEYAAKGASPSCEAVSYASYAAVPPSASCGSSPICMRSSSYYADQASTTDLLLGDGTFTYGQIIEDPSNKTAGLTIPADNFVEVEYALTPTANATGSAYCLRTSNNGTSFDSYSKVAELGMRFDPTITSWNLNNGGDITVSPGTTTAIYATGTASDQNTYTDLLYATSTFYRSGVGASCTADNNNCYQVASSSCTFSNCSGNSCDISCVAYIYFFADPTDSGTYSAQDWRADLLVSDYSAGHDTQSTIGSELTTMRALDVNTSIAYPSLEVTYDSGAVDATSTVQNIGNDAIDIDISGTNLTDGGSSVIPVTTQKYATSTFTYSSCVFCTALSTTSTHYEVDLSKPTTTTPVLTDDIYWGISIPFGASAAAHQGQNTFIATGD